LTAEFLSADSSKLVGHAAATILAGPIVIPRSSVDFLDSARTVQTARAMDYDQPDGERSMEKVVQVFNLLTGHELLESDGWLLQQLLKIVRDQSRTEAHIDSLLDNVGYGSLYAEARMAGK
jgi:hypothetical protein